MYGFSSLGPSRRWFGVKGMSLSALSLYTLICGLCQCLLGQNDLSVYMIQTKSLIKCYAWVWAEVALKQKCLYTIRSFVHVA